MGGSFLGAHLAVGGQDDEVAGTGEVGGGAVDADDLRAARAAERVRREAGAGRGVPDVDLLVLEDAGRVEEIGVDGDAAFVLEIGVGDAAAMDLSEEHPTAHGGPPWRPGWVRKGLVA